MALHAQFAPVDADSLWREWSSGFPGYSQADWNADGSNARGVDASGGITFGTLVALAKQGGYRPARRQPPGWHEPPAPEELVHERRLEVPMDHSPGMTEALLNLDAAGDAARHLDLYGDRYVLTLAPDGMGAAWIAHPRTGILSPLTRTAMQGSGGARTTERWRQLALAMSAALEQAILDEIDNPEFVPLGKCPTSKNDPDGSEARIKAIGRMLNGARQARTWRRITDSGSLIHGARMDRSGERECADGSLLVAASALDADTCAIGCLDGVVDLRERALLTGEDARQRLVTRVAPCHWPPERPSGLWHERLLPTVNTEIRQWSVDLFGASLAALAGDMFALMYGKTQAGKTTFTNDMRYTMGITDEGGYAATLPSGTFARQRGPTDTTPGRVKMRWPTRVAVLPEAEGERIDRAVLKAATGGEAGSTTRNLWEPATTARELALIVIVGNDLPAWGADDEAIADVRSAVVRLDARVDEVDGIAASDSSHRHAYYGDGEEACALRDDLFAALVDSAHAAIERGGPPEAPPSAREWLAEAREESLGDAGRWILSALAKDPDRARCVFAADVWDAALSASGAESKPWGMERRAFMNLVKRIHGLGPQVKVNVGGSAGKGWRGIYLLDSDWTPPLGDGRSPSDGGEAENVSRGDVPDRDGRVRTLTAGYGGGRASEECEASDGGDPCGDDVIAGRLLGSAPFLRLGKGDAVCEAHLLDAESEGVAVERYG